MNKDYNKHRRNIIVVLTIITSILVACSYNSRITKIGYVIANSPCTVDESYRGEIFIVFRSIADNPTPINVGDVIGQIEIPHHRQASFETVKTLEDLGTTDRGNGGFGSTAKK